MIEPEAIDRFFSFLYEGQIGSTVIGLRILAGIASSAFAAAVIVIGLKIREFYVVAPKPAEPEPPPETEALETTVAEPWREVQRKIQSAHPSDWNLAVIQADAILDDVFKAMGLTGETMGDRLRQLDPSKLRSLNDVWEAHKIRNRIAHDPGAPLDYQLARRAVMLIGEALRELQYLPEE